MGPPFVDAARLGELLPMRDAVDTLEAAFGRDVLPEAPPRSHVAIDDGLLLLMPAAASGEGAGVKLVTVNPDNPARGRPLIQGVYVLFEPGSLAPLVLFDGAAITALRTAAVSGLATRHLALASACRVMIFGAGAQARSHLDAMSMVRPVEQVWCVSPTPPRRDELLELARGFGIHAAAAEPDAVAEAEIVCTCTTSSAPVFDGARLSAGAHVNAVGAFRRDARELDGEAIRRARVVVETRAAALEEGGDLLIPLEQGVIDRSHIVADLCELVRGARVRQDERDVTVFKSVGVSFEDLAVARAAYERL